MSIRFLNIAGIPEQVKLPVELVVGICAIDDQHRLLKAQLDYLCSKAEEQTINSEIMAECSFAIGQTLLEHFRTEEEILRYNNVPADELARHEEEHSRIIHEYVALQDSIMTAPTTQIRDVLHKLENWIVTHISAFDVTALKCK